MLKDASKTTGNAMSNQPPEADWADEQQVEGTSAFSPNSVPQMGGKPFESKQEVTLLPSATGMDSAEESSTYPVSSARVPPMCFWMFAAHCQTTC
jgi:hypothetical protein